MAIRCACPTRACGTSRCSPRTSGGCGRTCRWSPACAATSTTSTTEATPGYNVDAVVAGAKPPIDPSTLPDPNGATYARQSLTGDIGLVANPGGRHQPVHPLRAQLSPSEPRGDALCRPATVGSIVPNVTVKPETGTTSTPAPSSRSAACLGGAYVFVNQYQDFIAQDLVVAAAPSGPLAQATNYADVRISGVEFSADAPIPRPRRADARGVGRLHARHDHRRREPAGRRVARRHAGRQHHAVEGSSPRSATPSRAAAGGWSTASARQGEVTRVARRCSTRRS